MNLEFKEYNKYKKNALVFSYEITYYCNLRCSYCYNINKLKSNIDLKQNPIDKKVIIFFKKLKKLLPNHRFELDILGGEPLYYSYLIDFLEEFLLLDIDVWVVSNLLNTDMLKKIILLMKKFPHLNIVGTWHDYTFNKKYFNKKIKENILLLKNNFYKQQSFSRINQIYLPRFLVSFVLGDHFDIEKYKFILDNNLDYALTFEFDNLVEYKNTFMKTIINEDIINIIKNSVNYKIFFELDDKKTNLIDILNQGLHNISKIKKVLCFPINRNIDNNGYISLSCPYYSKKIFIDDFNIKKDFNPVICKDKYCQCSIDAYKKVLK
jgi:hypothetical protein